METREQLQDQVAKYREREQNLKQKLEEQEQKLKVQEQNLDEQDQKFKGQDLKLKEQDQQLKELYLILKEQDINRKQQAQKLNEQDHKLKEQDQKLNEQDHKLKKQDQKLSEQDHKLKKQDQKLSEQDHKVKEQDQKLNELDHKLKEQDQKLAEQNDSIKRSLFIQLGDKLKALSDETEAKLSTLLTRTFIMENFSKEKEKGKVYASAWYGPAMYTHVGGYKFCIAVYANRVGAGYGKAMALCLYSLPGEFDGQLKWPVKAKFTLELVNQYGNNNVIAEACDSWGKSNIRKAITYFHPVTIGGLDPFIEHSQLGAFLVSDALHFLVSKIDFFKLAYLFYLFVTHW